ncbi:hypothetical protein HZY97_05270 [Sphingomonas sp. R-74633]|uniref:hypothetical protein n=1 Tax=Sphingomonas sp. R-74633 TaxID=2751188 RepID=UPI0015D34E2B|nr:hypothetical protein [Sphingomonas sp. R-74633]NYT40156.1 hypothetical protein [Sphingomonas sp. R-74633]
MLGTLLLGSCAAPPPGGTAIDYRSADNDPALCRGRGGTIEPRGMVASPMCVIRYADGGKTCSGKRDCQGACSVEYRGVQMPLGSAAAGQCQSENSNFGCLARVENGRIASAFLCTD